MTSGWRNGSLSRFAWASNVNAHMATASSRGDSPTLGRVYPIAAGRESPAGWGSGGFRTTVGAGYSGRNRGGRRGAGGSGGVEESGRGNRRGFGGWGKYTT